MNKLMSRLQNYRPQWACSIGTEDFLLKTTVLTNLIQPRRKAVGVLQEPLINIFLFFMITLPLFASVELRDEAIVENKVLTVISERFDELKLKQIDSNVFSDGDIKESQEVIDTISTIKEENIKDVISALEETVSTRSAAVRNKEYRNAKNEYGLAVAMLNGISKEKSERLKVTSQKNKLLEKQKELLKDLLKFNEEKSEPLDEEDLNKIIDMAARQEDLAKDVTDENTKKDMQEAQENIENARIDDAIDKQKEIVDDLEEKLGFDSADNDKQADSDSDEEASKMNQAIEEMKKKLQDSAENKNDLTDSERQEMAQEMSDISEEMQKNNQSEESSAEQQNQQNEESSEAQKDEQGEKSAEAEKNEQNKASKEMEKAMENMLENKDADAVENLKNAQEQMKKDQKQRKQQAKKQAEEKKKAANKAAADEEEESAQEESKPEKNQGENASEEAEPKNENEKSAKKASKKESKTKHGLKYGKTRTANTGDDWAAKLPEKERSAIQAARTAKSSPEMEEDIQRYFILLAREEN